MIATDKQLHAIAGLFIAWLGCLACLIVGWPTWPGLALAVLAGAGKELYDKKSGRGTPEAADFLATCAGGLIAWIIIGLIAAQG